MLKFEDANEHELWVATFLSRVGSTLASDAADIADEAIQQYRLRVPAGLPLEEPAA